MSNLNLNVKIHVIPMPLVKDYFILTSRINKVDRHSVIMTYITEEEELNLDKGKQLIIKRGDKTFTIDKGNIYCYGNVDFSEGSDDLEQIATFSFLDYLGAIGIHIPSDYNYDTHTCNSPLRCYRITETWRPDVLSKYAHGCLGKPDKIVLFIKRW